MTKEFLNAFPVVSQLLAPGWLQHFPQEQKGFLKGGKKEGREENVQIKGRPAGNLRDGGVWFN